MAGKLSHIQLACFSLGDRLFAVDIMRIREILLPQQLSALPRKSDLLDGVINLRGSVIPVMNMRKRLEMAADADTPTGKLLVVSLAGCLLALMVDDVLEIITVQVEEIKPPLIAVPGTGMEFILGVCLSHERVIMILDIDSLFDELLAPEGGYALQTVHIVQQTPESPGVGQHGTEVSVASAVAEQLSKSTSSSGHA